MMDDNSSDGLQFNESTRVVEAIRRVSRRLISEHGLSPNRQATEMNASIPKNGSVHGVRSAAIPSSTWNEFVKLGSVRKKINAVALRIAWEWMIKYYKEILKEEILKEEMGEGEVNLHEENEVKNYQVEKSDADNIIYNRVFNGKIEIFDGMYSIMEDTEDKKEYYTGRIFVNYPENEIVNIGIRYFLNWDKSQYQILCKCIPHKTGYVLAGSTEPDGYMFVMQIDVGPFPMSDEDDLNAEISVIDRTGNPYKRRCILRKYISRY
ncbi:hypothetical protein K9B33_21810 [Sphingobium sp. 3R8]|uniref:hypothetical protein n=1 Tax=Sphingobium sp. 3R8 TaxID=2874921 RepID=UPI001CCC4C22|nr:hypothetical protein [Sphingobium sp. 3R8]MBZ9650172.1 hypothetical protein [Sphingobium sp. 3R8]